MVPSLPQQKPGVFPLEKPTQGSSGFREAGHSWREGEARTEMRGSEIVSSYPRFGPLSQVGSQKAGCQHTFPRQKPEKKPEMLNLGESLNEQQGCLLTISGAPDAKPIPT